MNNTTAETSLSARKRELLLLRLKQSAVARAPADGPPPLVAADRSRALPLSFAQQRLWFMDQLDHAAGAAYHMPAALRLKGQLHRNALQSTLDGIMARHESLRTTFVDIDGAPTQLIGPAGGRFPLSERDLSQLPEDEREAAVATIGSDEVRAPFDLAAGPLIRGQLLRLADDEHILLITQHHIISDGWSIGILVQEVSALYSAFSQGQADPLPPLTLQYADYAAWQRNWLQGEVLKSQTGFWKTYLAGAPELLELPADRPRPALQSYAGAMARLTLPAPVTSGLKALSQRHGTTLFMTLLAGWAVLLARLSGQHDIVIGTPVANRQRTEIEALIGFFVNTLVLRVKLDDDPTVAALLARIRTDTLQAYAHQDLPFEQVVEALQPSRSMSYSPLFQVMLSMNNTPGGEVLHMPGLTLSEVEQGHTASQFDLSLTLTDAGDSIIGSLEYASDLFDESTIERLGKRFQNLMAGMAMDDQQHVSAIGMLDNAERAQLLVEFNQTDAAWPNEQLLHQRFEAQAAARPDAIALVAGDQNLSYGQLNQRANALAHQLLALGVRPDQRVALCALRGPEMVVGLLAILKAGGAYVPLDPAYPAERLAYMLSDSAPVALLTQASLAGSLPAASVPVLLLESVARLSEEYANPDPQLQGLTARHLAYVIYTSGSTGQPKGVMVEHSNVVNFVCGHIKACALTELDRVLQFASFSFDASVGEIFPALSAGATLVLRPADIVVPDLAFVALLDAQRITVCDLPTAFWHQWVQEIVLKNGPCASSLRLIVAGGEKAEARHLAAWLAEPGLRNCRWLNTYGPTETTVSVTAIAYDARTAAPSHAIPIGLPSANTRLYILDRHQQPVPLGVAGEIYVGGASVTRGYLNRPDLTAERFIADPFSDQPGARLYRTGDLGRWLTSGSVEYLGRNDFQVKLRGFRIELGEIESRLAACEGVREALVVAREDQPGDMRLVAYLLSTDGQPLDAATLRAALARNLAEHMIPSAYVTLDAFPLSPTGKLDRKALPAPDGTAVAAREYQAPQGQVEETIAAIWQRLLGLEQVGRADHFFELGGHSLMAVQLMSHLREQLGVELGLRELFTAPTLSGFATLAASARQSVLSALLPADRSRPLPLSFAQQRLWFVDQLDHAAGAAYHMPAGLRLKGRLDQDALRATLDRIVARHEGLRTTFASVDGKTVQVIAPADSGFVLKQRDLSALSGHEQGFAVSQISTDEVSQPFDLATGPLIRGQLLRLSEQEHVLLVTQHHIISDGWSIGILIQEVSQLYQAFSQQQPDPLPPLPLQYADYAAWQRNAMQGPVLQAQIDFWKGYLGGAPELLAMPTDYARPAQQSYAGSTVALTLSRELTAGLKALSARHGATLFMTMLAGWGILLARMSGQQDVVIGAPVANRQRTEVEGLIGFFVNTLALRVQMEDDPSVAELLARIKGGTLQAFAYQDLPFEQVVEALQPARSMGYSPLFQAILNWDSAPDNSNLRMPGLSLTPIEQTYSATQFDLSMFLKDTGDVVVGSLRYASDLFEQSSMERLASYFQLVLGAMVANDLQAVSAIPMLGSADRRQLLVDFNDTAVDYPNDQLIHQLFEVQAAARPDALAVVYEESSLTFAELNARANQVAHYLIAAGVVPDALVGLCVERSVDMIVGILGILKAGGAYLPLDPAHPADRLAHMLADSEPAALLTQGALLGALPANTLPVLVLDDLRQLVDQPEHNPDPRALGLGAANLAYVIYTSGSTGSSKGVLVEHRSPVNFWRVMERTTYEHCQPHGNVALNAAFSFDMSLKGILQLLSGRCVHLIPQLIRADGPALLKFLEQHRIEAFDVTPSQLAVLLAAGLIGNRSYRPTSVLIGGEAIDAATWQTLRGARDIHFYNMYGPTECTVDATIIAIRDAGEQPTIGGPIDNMQVYILDARRQPVPLGVVGEIHIGGAGVARGYLRRPELTDERFLKDPFCGKPGARMYKTGDLGRWLGDGTIAYLGRNDFQVKIRGFRIELGEIESKLMACAGVREAVVIAREDHPGAKRLVAYLTAQAQCQLSAAAVRAELAASLADNMIPSAFVVMGAFPLTPNGKLDRRALPAPDADDVASEQYQAPQGQLEQTIAAIWQELLEIERVGRHDHFFDLGGHSLLAVQLVSELREQLGIELGLRDLFTHPTLAQFAALAADARATELSAIGVADRSAALPLSFAQQRMWFLDRLDHAAGAAYHMPSELRLKGRLDKAALRATLDRLVARHENLRTTFVETDGVPAQVIAPADCGFSLKERDLGELSGHEQEFAVVQISTDEVSQPFDMAAGPMIRGQLLRLNDEEHILLVTQHHIISDGWSMGILVKEVSALYTAFCQGRPDPLPPLPVQYADYSAWQRNWLQGDVLAAQTAFWKTYLAGAPGLLNLPTDRARPALQSYAGSTGRLSVDAPLTAALRSLSQRHGTTLFMTLLAGWSALLARLSGQNDVIVGSPVANRQRAEIEPLTGFFVNMLALRVNLDDDPSVAVLLERVKASTLQAYEHQDLPFEQVVEALQPERSMAYSPLFQVMLGMNNTPDDEVLSLPGLTLSERPQEQNTAQFDLSLRVVDAGDTIVGSLEYASDLFDAATIERLMAHFVLLLEGMAGNDQRRVSGIALPGVMACAALPATAAEAAPVPPYEAPQGATEQAVASIWQELLGLERVGRHDHFFALGGYSMLGVQMLSRLHRAAGIDIGLRALFVHSTVQQFAAAIDEQQQSGQFANLVPIRAAGSDHPLFLVHPGEGEVGYARELAPWLAADLPVYGLAASGFLSGETPLATVEEMAASYIRGMRQVQPHGPYRVAGWSAGGTIAYEIANQLLGADQAVEFLGLIDTASHYSWPVDTPDQDFGFEAWLKSLAWMPQAATVAERDQLVTLAAANDVDAMLEHCQDQGMFPQEIELSLLRRHLAVRHAIAAALRRYVRPALPVPVALFVATGEQRADASLGWSAALGSRLNTVGLEGDHFSIMQAPHIRALGAALNTELERASARKIVYEELDYTPRITIQTGRAGVAPLFCVPGAGASVAAFAGLAQVLDPSIPIHGMQPRGLCGVLVPHSDVPSAARAYIKAMREVAPCGPYRLLGHSFGGWVATEMARQLVAAGEQVELLVVLDSDAPASAGQPRQRFGRVPMLLKLIELFELNLNRSLGLGAPELAPLDPERQLALLLARLVEAKLMPRSTPLQVLAGIVRVFATNLNTGYGPAEQYQGPLHLVLVPEPPVNGQAPLFDPEALLAGWRQFAPDTRHFAGPGNHMTLLSAPHVQRLADWLQPLLGVK